MFRILEGDKQHRNFLTRRCIRHRPVWGRHDLVHSYGTRLPGLDIRWERLGSCCRRSRRLTEDLVERVAYSSYLGDDGCFIVDVGLGDYGRGEWVELWGASFSRRRRIADSYLPVAADSYLPFEYES